MEKRAGDDEAPCWRVRRAHWSWSGCRSDACDGTCLRKGTLSLGIHACREGFSSISCITTLCGGSFAAHAAGILLQFAKAVNTFEEFFLCMQRD